MTSNCDPSPRGRWTEHGILNEIWISLYEFLILRMEPTNFPVIFLSFLELKNTATILN